MDCVYIIQAQQMTMRGKDVRLDRLVYHRDCHGHLERQRAMANQHPRRFETLPAVARNRNEPAASQVILSESAYMQ